MPLQVNLVVTGTVTQIKKSPNIYVFEYITLQLYCGEN